jgi:hypothetical protein
MLYIRRKSRRYPSDRRLGGLQNQSGWRGEETDLAKILILKILQWNASAKGL